MNRFLTLFFRISLYALVLFFGATETNIHAAAGDGWSSNRIISFGFDVRNNQLEDSKQYLPFLEYLSKATGYKFELKFGEKNEQVVDLLGTGKVQFAFVGADTYIQAHEKFGVVTVARGLNPQGKSEYQSVIVVHPASSISTVKELRGKQFAFGSKTSTQGRLIPLIILEKEGIHITDLAGHSFTGSHRNCAQAVARGESDACGMQDTLGQELAKAGLVKIIFTSDFFPSSGVAANQDVPAEVINRVKKALLDFKPNGAHKEGLYHWDKTEMPNGFGVSTNSDYDELLYWSRKLGLL